MSTRSHDTRNVSSTKSAKEIGRHVVSITKPKGTYHHCRAFYQKSLRWNSAPHNALLELAKVGSRETVAQLCEGILLPLAQLLMKSREKDRTVSKIPNWDREICQCRQSYEKIASRLEALFKVVSGNAQYDVLMNPNFPPYTVTPLNQTWRSRE